MHNQVRQWGQEGYLTKVIQRLIEKDFAVFLTSDHGNVEATGIGKPNEGATADMRGERVRVYTDPIIREGFVGEFPTAIPWRPVGLPNDFLPLLASGRSAFVQAGRRTVAHGGATMEEVIVPFVRVLGGTD